MKSNSKNNVWKKISSKIDYQNPYMQVRKDEVIRPNGKLKPFYVLDRGGPFSIVIPISKSGSTYLVGQYRYAVQYYSWEFPMGIVAGKSPLQMAKTELREETGITAKIWKKIGHFFVANGHSSQEGYIYIAKKLKLGKPEPEEDEFIDVKELELDKIDQMIEDNIIKDGCTITAFYFYNKWKTRNK